jgi:plasmid stabilization system protein ParE
VAAKFRVRITRAAERDIEETWNFIAHDNPSTADQFIRRLEEQIQTLETFPESCPLIPENELLGTRYRHMLYGNYRTVIRIERKIVYVIRVIHGARLLDGSMFED